MANDPDIFFQKNPEALYPEVIEKLLRKTIGIEMHGIDVGLPD